MAYSVNPHRHRVLSKSEWLRFASDKNVETCHSQNRAVGFCLWAEYVESIDILQVAILPQYQGQCLVRSMLSALLAGRWKGCKVFLEVSKNNLRAQSLYESIGFLAIHERLKYYPDGASAVLMSFQ